MKDYEVRVQDDGHMVLPADLRQTLGIAEGDQLVFRTSGDRVELITARRSRDRAQDRMKRLFPDVSGVVDDFLAERRAEAKGE